MKKGPIYLVIFLAVALLASVILNVVLWKKTQSFEINSYEEIGLGGFMEIDITEMYGYNSVDRRNII